MRPSTWQVHVLLPSVSPVHTPAKRDLRLQPLPSDTHPADDVGMLFFLRRFSALIHEVGPIWMRLRPLLKTGTNNAQNGIMSRKDRARLLTVQASQDPVAKLVPRPRRGMCHCFLVRQ